MELTGPLVPNLGWKTAGLYQGILSEKKLKKKNKNTYLRKQKREKEQKKCMHYKNMYYVLLLRVNTDTLQAMQVNNSGIALRKWVHSWM
jgi:hypothetical protein